VLIKKETIYESESLIKSYFKMLKTVGDLLHGGKHAVDKVEQWFSTFFVPRPSGGGTFFKVEGTSVRQKTKETFFNCPIDPILIVLLKPI